MTKQIQLIALLAIAAGALGEGSPAMEPGATFEAPDDAAAALITSGHATLDEAPKVEPEKSGKKVKARVLVDCPHGKCNEVVLLSATHAAAGEALGVLDTSKAAVAYAESLSKAV